jgi:hypothetical protein
MILLLASLALLQSDPQPKGETVSFTIIDKGPGSGFQVPQELFVSSLKDWVDTWATRQGSATPKRPHPAVEFDKEVVLVATLGSKNTGGYAIEITRIIKTKDDIQVFVKRTAPAEGAKSATMLTSPFVLARMKKPDRPVTFVDEEKK